METLRELKEARGKLYDKINEMNEKIKEINEKIKEIEIATAIVYCSDDVNMMLMMDIGQMEQIVVHVALLTIYLW